MINKGKGEERMKLQMWDTGILGNRYMFINSTKSGIVIVYMRIF